MSQSRSLSVLEAVSNTVVGYLLAVALQVLLFPFFGLFPSLTQSLKLGFWFTLISLLRSYALRRLFERLRSTK